MKEIYDTISTPIWLVTVLAASIVINVFSAYIKDFFDLLWRLFDRKREASASKRAHRRAVDLFLLRNDPRFHVSFQIYAQRDKTLSDVLLFMSCWGFAVVALQLLNTQKVPPFLWEGVHIGSSGFGYTANILASMVCLLVGLNLRFSASQRAMMLLRATLPEGQTAGTDYLKMARRALQKAVGPKRTT